MNKHRLCVSTVNCDIRSLFTNRCIEVYCETEHNSLRPVWTGDFPNIPGDAYIVNMLSNEDEIVLKLKGVPVLEIPGLNDRHFSKPNWSINLPETQFSHLSSVVTLHYEDFMKSSAWRNLKYA